MRSVLSATTELINPNKNGSTNGTNGQHRARTTKKPYPETTLRRLERILTEKLREEEEANAGFIENLRGITESDGGMRTYALSHAESASDRTSLEVGFAAVSHMSQTAREISGALARLRNCPETFGICITCRYRIPLGRMEALPQTQKCCGCAR